MARSLGPAPGSTTVDKHRQRRRAAGRGGADTTRSGAGLRCSLSAAIGRAPIRKAIYDWSNDESVTPPPLMDWDTYGNRTQPRGYRSPEDTLGLPVSEAIDMWCFGCVLLFLYLANHPFSVSCEYQGVKGFVDMLGLPADHLLKAGLYTSQFFIEDQHWGNPGWWLKVFHTSPSVEWTQRSAGQENVLVSLLTGLLQTDQKRRLTPEMGLKTWITYVMLLQQQRNQLRATTYHRHSSVKRLILLESVVGRG
ncbi:unnamed protein product [Pleuronectes platessa]|uniref:Protein kinase domain-containing protein n=1 Tax=Pleuronectes platessa TaxID=8262 RepID=A0A9N7ZFJ8_PLEPL|nr:unnamed protein product [Pleuronectes platessa]